MSTRTLTSAAFALALVVTAFGQSEEPAPAAVAVVGADPTHNSATRSSDTLSVDFPDEDIRTILRNVADLFELNLVVPDTLVGRTSIKLRDVTWRQIFQVVLSPAGYTYVEEGNIIKVLSNESLSMEPVATEVFILNHAKASDIKPTVDGLVDPALGGKILLDVRSNALVVTERPTRMTRIRTIIEQLDKATAQVVIESKFVEVTDRDVRNIGVNWASLQGMQLSARGMNQAFARERGQTTTQGNNTSNGTTTDSINNNSTNNSTRSGTQNDSSVNGTTTVTNTGGFTTSTTQSNSGSQLLPVTRTDALGNSTTTYEVVPISSTGTTTTTATPSSQTNTSTSTNNVNGTTGGTTLATDVSSVLSNSANTAVSNLLGLTNTTGTSRLASAVFSASDFNIIVSALKSQNNTKVVSNPTIVTLNNTEAVLNIGSEFPIPSYTYNSERGSFEVSGFEYKPIGIILKVTPQVNAQGTIRLALEPEVSQQNGSTTFGGAGGASIPIIATRKVKTQISLKDGYTAGIGGLIQQSKDHGGTKVPVLGSIPLLGRLFSSRSVNDQATNLLIFITAKSVNPDGASPEEVFSQSALDSVSSVPKTDLPEKKK